MRRNEVLVRMGALGPESPVGITSEREERAKALPLGLPKGVGKLTQKKQPFFVRYMIRQVLENANGQFDTLGRSVKARKRTLFEGGLQITTTVDPQWQEFAQQAAEPAVQRVDAVQRQGAPRHLDRHGRHADSGAIRTLLSGKNFMRRRARARDRPAPDGLGVQAVRARGRVRAGRAADPDLLERLALLQPAAGTTTTTASRTPREAAAARSTCGPPPRTRSTSCSRSSSSTSGPRPCRRSPRRWASRTTFRRWPRSRPVPPRSRPLDMAVGLRDARQRRRALHPVHGRDDRARRRRALYEHEADCERVLRPDIAHQITGDARARAGERHRGERLQCRLGHVAGRRQDRHRRPEQGGVVLRLHAPARDRGLGRVQRQPVLPRRRSSAARWRPRSGASYMVAGRCKACPSKASPNRRRRRPRPCPNVVGLHEGEGRSHASHEAGSTRRSCEVDSLEPEGIVAAQSPAGGTTVDLGIAVRIEVSSGKPPKTEVPGTIGMPEGDARAAVEQAGFVVEVVYEQVKDESKVGDGGAPGSARWHAGGRGLDRDDRRGQEGRRRLTSGRRALAASLAFTLACTSEPSTCALGLAHDRAHHLTHLLHRGGAGRRDRLVDERVDRLVGELRGREGGEHLALGRLLVGELGAACLLERLDRLRALLHLAARDLAHLVVGRARGRARLPCSGSRTSSMRRAPSGTSSRAFMAAVMRSWICGLQTVRLGHYTPPRASPLADADRGRRRGARPGVRGLRRGDRAPLVPVGAPPPGHVTGRLGGPRLAHRAAPERPALRARRRAQGAVPGRAARGRRHGRDGRLPRRARGRGTRRRGRAAGARAARVVVRARLQRLLRAEAA